MSHPSIWPEVRSATLASLLRSRAAEHGERTAFVFLADGEAEGERLTYAGLDAHARAIAAALREGLAPGDRALLLYPPGLEFIAAFFGCLHAGVVAVPAYPPRSTQKLGDRSQGRLRAIARDAEPKAALTTAPILAALSEAALVPELAAARWIATDDLEGLEGSAAELPEPDPGSVAFLQYTSGSTAAPKGVMVTHANLLHNERMIGAAFRQDAHSVVVGWLPLYHDMGLIGNVLQPLHAGGSCVLMAPVAFLQKPLRWLEAIHRYRGTTSGGPNFAYELCLRRITEEQKAGLDLSRWRLAYNGAEPVRAETLERFAAAFAPCGFRREAFYPCYGLAEATLFVSGGTAGRAPRVARFEERPLVSCGHAWEGQRIAVVDPEAGEKLGEGAVGEIWVAGPSVARGYWRNPEATERDFQARLTTGEGPFLRTGDLGFLRDGELYVTGRIKDLVIIRGRNHYPQDIELTAERSHPGLRPGCGAAFSVEIGGEERLVLVQEVERRRREGLEEIVEAVRRAVAEEHEVQVHDVVLVRVGTVPKTSSGKIQRRATRVLYLEEGLEVVGRGAVLAEAPAAPEAPVVPSWESLAALEPAERRAVVERFLRERAAAAVGVPAAAIDSERPLTAYGLDSLAAIEIKSAVESALGVALPLAELLEGAGIERLAELLTRTDTDPHGPTRTDTRGPCSSVPVRARPCSDPLLSHGERALWFLHRLAPEGGAYNVAVAARARRLDPAALRRTLTALALRHPSLRSVFPVVDDQPVRRVLEDPEIDFAVEDATGWSEAWLAERLADEAYRPFDLSRGPLLRVRAFDRPHGEHALLLAVHHIAVDFASLAVVARDLAALYRDEELAPLPLGYSDFVRWQDEMLAGPRGERLWEHWRETLASLPDLDLPADRPRPPLQTYCGGARTLELPPDLADGIRALAAGQGVTLFTALLAVFQVQLGRYSGQDDFAVGSPAAGRPPGLAGVVGYFVNPVALRADLAGDPAFAALLDRTRRAVLAGLENADFPFALLAERLRPARDPARTPLFQVMFQLQRSRPGDDSGIATFALGEAGGRLDLGPVELESLRLEERRAQFDLALRAAEEEGGRIRASLEFNADLFDAATAERLLGHFRTLLAGAVANPAARLADLPFLTASERAGLLASGQTSGEPAEPVLLQDLFEERVRSTPDAAALEAEGAVISYAELRSRAGELARSLRALGVGPEVRVAVALERSPDLVVALLATLEAGGAYLPIDPAYPQERVDLLLADSGARVLVHGSGLQGLAGDGRPPWSPPPRPDPRNLAYVLYTSGSTGRPKGVAVDHATAAAHFRAVARTYGFGPGERILFFASPSFDVALEQVLPGLLAGATIVLRGQELWEPSDLARRIEELGLTFVNLPTAFWSRWAQEAADLVAAPAALRLVLVGGEEMPADSARRWRRSPLARVPLLNGYGPTETVVTATLHEVRDDEASSVSIGRPLPGRSAHVVDPGGGLLPAGARGELVLGGVLARGYLGAPDRTAERFVPDPFAGRPGARLYRTGDLVRRRADGDLEFLGRIDTQLKVRGFRVEAGEIEAALLAHPDVREAIVLLHEEALAAWVVLHPASTVQDPQSLRSFLSGKLPAWMVPASCTLLPALPLTPHGKIDRRALPRPSFAVAGEGWTAPRTALEEGLAAVWAQVLGVERVGVHDDFFRLGGHSLLATRLAARVRAVFGIELPVSTLFQAPTVAALTGRIAAAAGGAAAAPVMPALRPHEGREDLPLSFAQQRLWFLDRLQPGGAAYNMPGAAELEGALDVAALAAALSEIVRRHEALRTRFVVHDGEPVQVIDPLAPAALGIVDLTGLPEARREAEAGARMSAEAAAPFDLGRGPLFRTALLRLAPDRHRLLLTLHHMVADGWSLGVLLAELAALYGRTVLLPEPPVQYADWVVWQRRWLTGEALDRQLAWWTEELAGAPTTLELPADRPRPVVRTEQGSTVRAALPGALADGVRTLARRHGATPFMALLAAFQTLLLRVTGQDDLLVGSAIAGRTRPEVEGLIGFFANTLVLRGALAGDPSFLDALEQARRRTAGAWAHQDLPVERLVEELQPGRERGTTPLFQVVFVLQSAPVALALPGLAVRRLPVASGTAKFDLMLELTEQEDGLAAAWELSRDLFDEATIERWAGWFSRLLAGAAEAPERRLSDLPLLAEAELRQILLAQNPTKAPLDTPVHRLFEEHAARGPERIALVLQDRELTYGALNHRADRLARRLIAEGVGPETLVGVLLERSFEMIEAFLAILKAGGAYVPLDLAWPGERLASLIDEAGIRLVITKEFLAEPGREEEASGVGGRLAYAMFTSGSTGRPKTVGVEHRSIVRLVRDTDFAEFGPDQVFLQLAAPAFDAATLEIWGALLHGARLVLPPAATPSLDELGEVLARHGVTTLWLTAGLFHQVVESRIGILRGVRQLLAGGDVLAPAAVDRVLAELPGTRLINGYGPTENTTFTCCHTVAAPVPPGRSVPIGRPVAGTRVYVVDRWLQPVGPLVPGELLAGGEGLARGYLGRPDLTAERFVPDPFDQPGARLYRTGDLVRRLPSGEIEFLGRIDRQVKIRGFRAEPGEIEAVLSAHPAVAQAAVVVREPGPGDRRLVAYVVLTQESDLRAWLSERLPAYLIPALVALPELPLTANGKVDRRALERIEPGAPERAVSGAPRTPVEERIAAIWAEVLGVERVGIHDDFFELGGHSLLATRAVSRIVDALRADLPLSTFFETPTVAGLAERLFGPQSAEAPERASGEANPIPDTWNDTAVAFEGAETLLLSDLVAAQATRTPQAQAVAGWRLSGEERLTYAELLARADRLAGHLAALGVGPEARVGVCLDRTVDLPVALLAVLRAGGAYVPLDPAYPRERLEFMLRDSGAGVLLTQRDLAGRCGPFAGATVWLDQTDRSDANNHPRALPGSLAYLIYTSGSTGLPKAVAIEHRSAVAMVQWALGAFSGEELAGVLFATSVCFDLSVFELFVPLAAGGKVLVAANALELPSLPFGGEVTLVNTVPSAMAEMVRGEGLPVSVRTVNLAGEPLRGALVDAVYALPGVRRVVNLYGPSEDTTYSTWETVPPAPRRPQGGQTEPLIGRPVANTRVYLLDEAGRLVPEGVPGELFLAGAGLARGYLGRPDLTAERFVPDPWGDPGARLYRTGDLARWQPGGRLEYLGRIDHQVKVRGFRIEPGEIEAALARHPAIGEVVVLARDEDGQGRILAAFLVRREGMEEADLRPGTLRQFLRRSLPEHMVPDAWVELPALPLTPNGKIDRRALSRLRLDAHVAPVAPILPVPRQGALPLSFAQERLWFLDRIQPGSAYNVPLALRLRGPLDVGRLGAAFGAIVARHEALRTVFTEHDGEPAQRILPAASAEAWPLPVVDLTEPGTGKAAAALAEAEALCPFDLATGPLLRTTLLRLGAADHVLLLDMHHIVSDGWSLGVLLDELAAFYGGTPERLPELPVQYADFAVWQKGWLRGEELERQTFYWRRQLAGAPAVLDLPLDRPRPTVATANGARRPVTLAPALTADLAACARRQGATPFMLLLAAWMVLLHRISGQEDLSVGTPVAGRNRPEIERLVGFFVNTLVMRADLSGAPAFPDLLAQVRRTALAAYDHQSLPFEKLVDELRPERDMSHPPLFQVMLALQNAPLGALELPGLTLEPIELEAAVAKFDLTLHLMELGGTLSGSLEYNTDLFDATTMVRWIGHLGALLEGIATQPERPVAELLLLTPEEMRQLVDGKVRRDPDLPAPPVKERAAFAAPRDELEAAIAAVWREVFGLEDPDALGVHDNFFDAGGSSLLLARLHSRLQKALGRRFPLAEMFKHPTIAALAASLGAEAPAQPSHDQARARTETRRTAMRQMQQLRDQRRSRTSRSPS